MNEKISDQDIRSITTGLDSIKRALFVFGLARDWRLVKKEIETASRDLETAINNIRKHHNLENLENRTLAGKGYPVICALYFSRFLKLVNDWNRVIKKPFFKKWHMVDHSVTQAVVNVTGRHLKNLRVSPDEEHIDVNLENLILDLLKEMSTLRVASFKGISKKVLPHTNPIASALVDLYSTLHRY